MKLIVDIPDNWEKELNQSKITFADVVDIDTIRNGIPLDKIRAEIADLDEGFSRYYIDRPWVFKDEVLHIIDKYKAESEDV